MKIAGSHDEGNDLTESGKWVLKLFLELVFSK